MLGITLNHLRGRLARRLFAAIAVSAVVPVAVAMGLVYIQLESMSQERKTEQMLDAAKAAGMTLFSQLTIASVVLENEAERFQAVLGNGAAPALRGVNNHAVNVLGKVESAPIAGLPDLLAGAGLQTLTPVQESWLQKGEPVLLWSIPVETAPAFYLLRMDARGAHVVLGRLNDSNLWNTELNLSRTARIVVMDTAGTVLHYARESGSRTDVTTLDAPLPSRALTSRSLDRWQHNGLEWQGVSWELFLEASFAAEPLRFAVIERPTTIGAELGSLQSVFPGVLLLALVFGLWLAVTQLRRYLDPLLRLTEGTKALAARRFDERMEIATGDELAELGDAFNAMADSIQSQFVALESLAEIDRMLLASPGLEQVLDALLPRVAAVTGCSTVSVLITDADAPTHARSYDLIRHARGTRPVRRVEFSDTAVKSFPPGTLIDAAHAGFRERLPYLSNLHDAGVNQVELWPLLHRDVLLGLLVLGYGRTAKSTGKSYGHDFADRLTVALTNFRHEERLYRQANFDLVTGLANRHLLREKLSLALEAGPSNAAGALLYIDLDDFKRVNDSAGHTAGDQLLQAVAQRLRTCAREGDTVARLGGDEFVLLSPVACDPDTALLLADKIIERLTQPFSLAGGEHFVSASIGIVMLFSDGMTVEELLRNGDIAMYRAKETGRGRAVFFAMDMHDRMRNRAEVEAGMRRAIINGEFELFYQPIHDRHGFVGAEALIRWRDPSGELLSPGLFIPIAEETGLIAEIGAFAIRTVCAHWAAWHAQGCAPRYVSVNVSPRQLRAPGFAASVIATLRAAGMPASAFQMEVTESVVAEGPEAIATLHALASAGISIALDDFGTGYSSLSYLRTFPIDVVKIDRSFVIDLPDNSAACRLVETIIGMAHSLEKKVVAEGVETPAQREFLLRHGCDRLQGYLLGRPMSATALNALLFDLAGRNEPRIATG